MIKSKNDSRNNYGISLLRVLATLSVIFIHVSAPIVVEFGKISNFNWNVANFYDSISRYAVPVFFMISGSLLLGKEFEIKDFLKKRLGKIIPPFLFWSLLYCLTNRYIFNHKTFNISKIVRDVFYGSEYHLWFVFALIGVYLIAPIFQKWIHFSKQNDIKYFLIIWILTLFLTIPGVAIYFPKIDFTYFSGFIGYFILGYYLKIYVKCQNWFSFLLILIGLSVTIFGTYFMTNKNNEFYYYFYEYLSLNTLMVCIGIFMIFKKIDNINDKFKPIISKLNDCSFGIYLIHPLVLSVFTIFGFNNYFVNPIIDILIVSLACFSVSFIVIYFIKKIKNGNLIA
ncbi:acyltransferase [Flavobacterium urocaniciphilum]|uniref:Surface polysaccharide O-acyltransferase, integral membrane enzyme n=1 Tax=Flavobacterium urocaniciphilum TaxID=1299341 RepID=A0A1H8YRQ9_9FLAO|nr:acyltransferase family protein [Flavobacterium urocaniciphilum]SEP54856.1 Surface polysaccharide O-acyltransferase, integral membrane enzyme [Flavobacterium urocaniciphilum]